MTRWRVVRDAAIDHSLLVAVGPIAENGNAGQVYGGIDLLCRFLPGTLQGGVCGDILKLWVIDCPYGCRTAAGRHRVAGIEQRQGQTAADKSQTSGYENVHRMTPYGMARTTPPSTRSAAPLVAEDRGLQT